MLDTIEVFISYSKQDKELRDGLLAHLRPLERQGIISWHDHQILPGTCWDEEIRARLNAADIILLLISADFLSTNYCTQVEIPEALRRHEAGEATVMPVILRHCSWKFTDLAAIQAYPEKAKPIKSWTDIDEAYTNVVDGVYLAATEIKKRRDDLSSDRGIDYTLLRDLLKAGKWQRADNETCNRIYEAAGRAYIEDIEQFPCTDLRTIDRLWVKYSNGKFGFSVQKKIWQECGSPGGGHSPNWEKFGDRVGWRVEGKWGNENDNTWDISAPEGHLPVYGLIAFGKPMLLIAHLHFLCTTPCEL